MARLQRRIVGFLELAQDLRLSQHHRIEPASYFEQVMNALRFAQAVNLVGQRLPVIVASHQKLPQRCETLAGFQLSCRINLYPVARGQDHRLLGDPRFAKHLQHRRHSRFGKSESFPDGDRRRSMAQADDENRHAQLRWLSSGRLSWSLRTFMDDVWAKANCCPRTSATQKQNSRSLPKRTAAPLAQISSA